MSYRPLLPQLVRQILENTITTEDLENLEFLDQRLANIISRIANNSRFTNLLFGLTSNQQEQEAALVALVNMARNDPSILVLSSEEADERIMNIFRGGILNFRNGAGPSNRSPPGSPSSREMIQQQTQAPGAPSRRRVRAENEEPSVGMRRNLRRRTETEQVEVPPGFVEKNISKVDLGDDCHICLNPLNQDSVCMLYSCGHVFHCTCVKLWVDSKRSSGTIRVPCPICRSEILRVVDVPSNGFGNRNYASSTLKSLNKEIKYLKSI